MKASSFHYRTTEKLGQWSARGEWDSVGERLFFEGGGGLAGGGEGVIGVGLAVGFGGDEIHVTREAELNSRSLRRRALRVASSMGSNSRRRAIRLLGRGSAMTRRSRSERGGGGGSAGPGAE